MTAWYERRWLCAYAMVLAMGITAMRAHAAGPVALRVDNLKTPLGLDDAKPSFSWQLDDPTHGAKQTAYAVQVATSAEGLRAGKADVWDRAGAWARCRDQRAVCGIGTQGEHALLVAGDGVGRERKGICVERAGVVGDGLVSEEWRAGWIGYETAEEAAVRHAPAQWIASPDPGQAAANGEERLRFARQ